MCESNIIKLFDEWNDALQTGDPKKVTALYATDATLLPTISNKVRHNHKEIEDYFVQFLALNPFGKINESNVKQFGDIAINSGIYAFTLNGTDTVQVRYTFVYHWSGKRWLIKEHHSSRMPE